MDITIVIVARNAEQTIERAITSAGVQDDCPILLVDDASTDNTVALAQEIESNRLTVRQIRQHTTLGAARQTALSAIKTKYAVWLDADDEFYPERAACMLDALKRDGSDIAADCLDLYDGETNTFLKSVETPDFIKQVNPIRLLERNYLPGIGQVAFKTEYFRTLGYDIALDHAEDVDIVLRAVYNGAQFSFVDDVGYRMYAYKNSVSRQLNKQRCAYRICLKKFPYDGIRERYLNHGIANRIASWALVAIALFREEYEFALNTIQTELADAAKDNTVLEPFGPEPFTENWRYYFFNGTVQLFLNQDAQAVASLEQAANIRESAETYNNLGVAYARLGKAEQSRIAFEKALSISPDYLDARKNLENPSEITSHPLRVFPGRNEYGS
ncbi:MAG: hypothetical protein COZ46_00220 [Verrucomicrobia bacterium CG_4_10_14_3_um_filter_43_23]|nr:MAG: hypothetical protein AUJ82_04720 [Verrucomicrobia bacterium CG1_02_43_26]PIP59003.1 MAG: hypothetical protein COX01_05485 [Verrucomicrobia bacterium CG22_combo_CG10-13_8_21_14_all_43_17]PIX59101.1 MAG: hypothetical protein COZ46_00220 [Verrucomicrobia bacterium CG_4_10_14_3_um_filter_43_23]PIY61377.1 MAG: hypothetical protein COY94_05890 [Verrucomicrobia bacterium CG_4_10_14_0_8_um_filter_43_34]PJA44159.1 MAG: hypothetical protein CO175_04605 [Verrucomicrobia bacterium CG_4_9_14_3_um_fi